MSRFLIALALISLLAGGCKPTPRTDPGARRSSQATAAEQQNTPPDTPEAPEPQEESTAPEPTPTPPQENPPAPPSEPAPSDSLVEVTAAVQDFNLLRPWEKKEGSTNQAMGVYLGEGKVLTNGSTVQAATYVEIGLPDHSQRAVARVLRIDPDLNLALLSLVREQDAALFESRVARVTGEPLRLGDTAELWSIIRGVIPVRLSLTVESGAEDSSAPRLQMQSAQPMPQGLSAGLPVIREGKLVALSTGYQAQTQTFTCTNAELIRRFLSRGEEEPAGVPVLGATLTELDDPVFRAYLKLQPNQGGLYIGRIEPDSAAESAGLKEGDVVMAIDGISIDNQGRCLHPLYGMVGAGSLIRSIKPMGEHLTLTVSRDGQVRDVDVTLNRDALEKGLIGEDKPGVQPRYIMWGGLLFQPLTSNYLQTLRSSAKGLPLHFLELERREKELREKGYRELVALTLVVPTPATLGYDHLGFCLVEAVNGEAVHSFSEFAAHLDAPTPDGIVELQLNKPPYRIYLDRQAVERSNDLLRRSAIPRLRAE